MGLSRLGFSWILVAHLLLWITVEACHNAEHERERQRQLAVAGRRKRATQLLDVDPMLSGFFAKCIGDKHPFEFISMASVVDLVIRDGLWFKATDEDFCSGRKDSAKCWRRRIDFLLNLDSSLINSTKQCISDYDRYVKDKLGPEFENNFIATNDLYDYDISPGEFKRSKRSIEDVCPDNDVTQFGICLTNKVQDFLPVLIDYPSLQAFDEESNSKFLTQHHSSCRVTSAQQNGTTTFSEHCPTVTRPDPNSPGNSETVIANINSCVIDDYVQTVRSGSPIFPFIFECRDSSKKTTTTSTTTTTSATTIATTSTTTSKLPPQAVTTTTGPRTTSLSYKRPSSGKRIGKCGKGGYWTKFYNSDTPQGNGDIENLSKLREKYRGQICKHPLAVDVRNAADDKFHSTTGDDLFISVEDGLRCFNDMQVGGSCADYKIRFCCRTEDPPCSGNYQWTPWLDRDRPHKGEDESLEKHFAEGNACAKPIEIRARVKSSKKHYWKALNILEVSPTYGLTCRKTDQLTKIVCKNYEVSFCCPKA